MYTNLGDLSSTLVEASTNPDIENLEVKVKTDSDLLVFMEKFGEALEVGNKNFFKLTKSTSSRLKSVKHKIN